MAVRFCHRLQDWPVPSLVSSGAAEFPLICRWFRLDEGCYLVLVHRQRWPCLSRA
ncbi:MAG: hypothetical protein N3E46_15415 [Gemmataceae bacterium]|nr:hypothetical protein [Gemmataceae bacterium]